MLGQYFYLWIDVAAADSELCSSEVTLMPYQVEIVLKHRQLENLKARTHKRMHANFDMFTPSHTVFLFMWTLKDIMHA